MSNTIKKCPSCKGLGLVNIHKMDARGGSICPICKGLGVPIYDENFDNALPFLGEENDEFIDLDDEE